MVDGRPLARSRRPPVWDGGILGFKYRPVTRFVRALAQLARPIQSGEVNRYLFYVFVVVLIAYAVYAT
jgi:hypothetical protein